MASGTSSEPTLKSSQSKTGADARLGASPAKGLSQAGNTLTASGEASSAQLPSSAASVPAGHSASDQQAGSLPGVLTSDTPEVQQASLGKVQAASMHAAAPDAQLQPSPSAKQRGYTAPPSLAGAHTNGTAVTSAAALGAGLSNEPHSDATTAAFRDEQLQAAALEGTTIISEAAANAGLSLPTPRSGIAQHQLGLTHSSWPQNNFPRGT